MVIISDGKLCMCWVREVGVGSPVCLRAGGLFFINDN